MDAVRAHAAKHDLPVQDLCQAADFPSLETWASVTSAQVSNTVWRRFVRVMEMKPESFREEMRRCRAVHHFFDTPGPGVWRTARQLGIHPQALYIYRRGHLSKLGDLNRENIWRRIQPLLPPLAESPPPPAPVPVRRAGRKRKLTVDTPPAEPSAALMGIVAGLSGDKYAFEYCPTRRSLCFSIP